MTVTIQHERGDQGRFYWVRAPLQVSVDGTSYSASRWSMAGVAIEGLRPQPRVGQSVSLRVTLPFQGYEVSFSTTGVVETADRSQADLGAAPADDAVIVRFDALTNRDRDLLTHFLTDLVQGRMVSGSDTLRRIDVPVEPTRLASDHVPTRSDAYVRRPLRVAAMSAGYLALGATLIGYLATLAYTNIAWLDIPVAAVNAEIEAAHATGTGVITLVPTASVGARVKAGDVVARIVDTDLERDIRLAEIAVREREMRWRVTNYQMLQRRFRRLDVPSPERSDVGLAQERQRELINQRRDLEIKAPFDGVVAALPVKTTGNVRKGDVVALFERNGRRRDITAHLTLAELERVRVGSRALIRVPGEDRTVMAEVAEINPNGGLIARMSRGTALSASVRPAERQADVKLSLIGSDESVGVQPGQPVIVMLERDSVRRFAQAMASVFGGARKAFAAATSRGPAADK